MLPVWVLMLLFGIGTMGAQAQQRVPILLYHNIAQQYENPLLHVSKEQFAAQMDALQQAGYQTIGYADFLKAGLSGGEHLPDKPIIITFDDGYASVYRDAFPILRERGMQATVFVITDRMGKQMGDYRHFSWEEAAKMEQSGVVAIESHTHSHPDCASLSEAAFLQEIQLSKAEIELHLGKECRIFAYPYGMESPYAQCLQAAGYAAVNVVGDQGVNLPEDGPWRLKRLTVQGDDSPQRLLELIRQEGR